MRGLRKYLTPFAPDQSGAVSVLYELGGIIVICDAGGCAGNVCGFDEPRWFEQKSAVFSAGLRDMDAILGRDDRLVAKLVDAAEKVEAGFAAVIGTPVHAVIGTDYQALKRMCEKKTDLPVLAVNTDGMELYDGGERKAYLELFKVFAREKLPVETGRVGILGMTPQDVSDLKAADKVREELKKEGKIRHIGITAHKLYIAEEAIESGLYETLQFPFCYLATEEDKKLVEMCKEADMGFIAMKALSGGLITNSAAAYAFEAEYDNVLPIWGVQRMSELEEFLSYIVCPPTMTEEIQALIEKDRKELMGDFCRGCGYCMPCPAGIEINNCARMSLMIRRAPSAAQLTPEMQKKMMKIEDCLHCGACMKKCPYHLNTPELLQKNLKDYKEILAGKKIG